MVPRRKPSVRSGILTAVNCLLIVLILLFCVVLALGSFRSGSFNLFGCSWHYYQSDAMTGEIDRNELIAINDDQPADFQPDDIIAFYADDVSGRQVIQIARLLSVNNDEYTVSESDGEPFILSSRETVFIGTVTFHSKMLGNLVQQMRTKEGRQIFLGWSVAILMFACGLTILLHVQRARRLDAAADSGYPDDDYDDGYYDDDYDDGYYDDDYDDYDEDYPEEEGMRLDRLPPMPPEDAYDDDDGDYDYDDDLPPEDTGYVDEQNMNLIAASTESEDEEDADFDAIFREISRTLDKDKQ